MFGRSRWQDLRKDGPVWEAAGTKLARLQAAVGGAVGGVLVSQGAGRVQTLTMTDALTYESLPREFRYSAW